MGRGRSNLTKTYWAAMAYQKEWLAEHPEYETRGQNRRHRDFERQLKASRWFKKHFLDPVISSSNHLDTLLSKMSPIESAPEAWYQLAMKYPIESMIVNTIPHPAQVSVGGLLKPFFKGKKPVSERYRYLHYNRQEEKGTETEYRKRAQFYLILVKHFLGQVEAKKLLKHYKEHKVRYRKIRTDQGYKLEGSELVEFKMRLSGHQLLTERPDAG